MNKNKIKNQLNETSTVAGIGDAMVDDGPLALYKNFEDYSIKSTKVGKQLGMIVVNYLCDKNFKNILDPVNLGNKGHTKKQLPKEKIEFIANKFGFKIVDRFLRETIKKEIKNSINEILKEI